MNTRFVVPVAGIVLAVCVQACGLIHLSTRLNEASKLNNEGVTLWESGDCRHAEELLRQSLAIVQSEAAGTKAHASVLGNLGGVLCEEGSLAEAQNDLEKSADILRRGREASPRLASVLGSLSWCYARVAAYDKAETCAREALAVATKSPASSDSDIVTAMMKVAQALEAKRKLAEAESTCMQALQRIKDKDDLLSYNVYEVLGQVYQDQQRFDLAEDALNKAVGYAEKVNPFNRHGCCSAAYNGLANFELSHAHSDRAAQLYNHALMLVKQQLGQENFLVGICLSGLAMVHFDQKNISSAKLSCKRPLR